MICVERILMILDKMVDSLVDLCLMILGWMEETYLERYFNKDSEEWEIFVKTIVKKMSHKWYLNNFSEIWEEDFKDRNNIKNKKKDEIKNKTG